MGLQQLPDELLVALREQWPCRDTQLRQLSALISPTLPSPSTVVLYGPHATGKSSIITSYLQASGLKHAVVSCQECVTGRHLLERTIVLVHQSLQLNHTRRCENLGALSVHLQKLLESDDKFILVFDGVDKQREAPPTLLPALARLGEMIPSLTVVLIVQHPPPRLLHQTGISHINFPSYTRKQSIHIASQSPLDIFPEPLDVDDYDESEHEQDKAWLWPKFCAVVWDSLAQNIARDLVTYTDICQRLWRPFLEPVVAGKFGTRDFSRLFVAQTKYFQDESVLIHSIVPNSSLTMPSTNQQNHQLPYYAKWLLISAYLASFNPARLDALYFMKTNEKKRRKKGGGTARSGGRASQTRKIPRRLLVPSAFTLDRALSIMHTILPHDFRSTIDVSTQVATLTSLKLLVRTGGIGGGDVLEPGGKWRVGPAVTWEYAQALGRSLADFDLIDYLAE